MNSSALRFVRQVGVRRRHCVTTFSAHSNTTFANQFNRRAIGAAYSSLSRESSEGKSVIITGSSQGIGKAIALRLAADGYNVCVNDLSKKQAQCDEVAKEIRSMGRKACTAVADVTKQDEVKRMIETSVRELGPLNTMIANAGIVEVREVLEVSEQDFRRMLDINVLGVHNCLSEAAKQLINQGDCDPTAQWAVRGLVEVYAMSLAKHNITANTYAPGIIGTEMWETIDAGFSKISDMERGTVMATVARSMSALGRPGTAEDVAKMVSFLASSDSDYITGQSQLVDGGIVYT
ncbi:hypothetical protein NUW58_g7107 [Xylaria curta]|uniref:Uncharacterized protein n=1 Tax=Xylaria curta TaxID=42375 RepID=A0ACC1NN14_9PEZI|nr:hypothetical protein NUW58_g7107 [Xylaria curta]